MQFVFHRYQKNSSENQWIFPTKSWRAGADWQIHAYGHTLHAFTNPAAQSPESGTQYNDDADRRSWQSLLNFLEEVF